MARFVLLLSKFGNYLGAGWRIVKDIESFECIKAARNSHNHKHLWGN
jgi:hypothetical protein